MRYLSILTALGMFAVALLSWFSQPDVTAAAAQNGWGAIKGQVVWAGGAAPTPQKAKVENDKAHCLSKGDIYLENYVINKDNQGMKWVFVWLAPDPPDPKGTLPIHPALQEIKDKEVAIDQPCCMYEPHALAIREGQTLVAKNSSPISHNVKWGGHPLYNPGGNVIIPPGKAHEIKNLRADERFPVKFECNIHGWMTAWARVFKHPYYAVTDEDGHFEIKLAPAGNYRLKVWHEEVGYRGGAAGRDGEVITIRPDGVTDLGKLDLKP
ncbi:MAG: hypothetical protein ACK4RK_08715 [Gemmataceae bacterium]